VITPKTFSKKLLQWSKSNPRDYPWIGEKDPYKIWISEVILQQTRSEQGKNYYENFIKKFPTVRALADATEDSILHCWKGLGYYSRARNLHHAAKTILVKFQGKFPKSYEELLTLKGIGEYSAAAISSFAYNSPKAVVDGNVVRVLSRMLGMEIDFHTSAGKLKFIEIANSYLDKENAGAYNQAIMNFGAVQCMPRQPDCLNCIFSQNCFAYQNNCIDKLPVRNKKITLKRRYIHYFYLVNSKGEIAIHQRVKKDIWQKLYELPAIETSKKMEFKSISSIEKATDLFRFSRNSRVENYGKTVQKLSHQEIHASYYCLKTTHIDSKIKPEFYFVKPENLVNFAFPKILSTFLENIINKK
jgi:A/G-specific adenine glycosylase